MKNQGLFALFALLTVFAFLTCAAAPKARENPAPAPQQKESATPPATSDIQVDSQLGTRSNAAPAAQKEEEEKAASEEWLQEIRKREVEKEALRIQRSVTDLDKTNERLR